MRVRGAREHNLKNVDVDVPRDALVVFSGVSGSGKSSLAFGTMYAEAQRRYLESVAPYARRLIDQVGVPDVDSIDGLPPAIALQQQRGTPSVRSSVGSVTTLSSLVRMLYSRAGSYPPRQPMLFAEDFSPNTAQGACPNCHGLGYVYEVTEQSMVPDPSLSIRDRAIAAWPPAWHGQNLRDILVTLGYDVDIAWRKLPKKARDWILFTEEQPTVPVYPGFTPAETRAALRRKEEPAYMGTFMGARRYVLHTFATTQSALMKKRVARYMLGSACPVCDGKRLKREALSVTFAGLDIGALSQLPLNRMAEVLAPSAQGRFDGAGARDSATMSRAEARAGARRRVAAGGSAHAGCGGRSAYAQPVGREAHRRAADHAGPGRTHRHAAGAGARLPVARPDHADAVAGRTAAPAPGHADPFEPVRRRLRARRALRRPASGRQRGVAARAGPAQGGRQHDLRGRTRPGHDAARGLAGGRRAGCRRARRAGLVQRSTGRVARRAAIAHGALPVRRRCHRASRSPAPPSAGSNCKASAATTCTASTRVSRSRRSPRSRACPVPGKSSLVSQALVELVCAHLGHEPAQDVQESDDPTPTIATRTAGRIAAGADAIRRIVNVDQKPIGRTPRSNLATYTGLFDHVRKLFAATKMAKARRYDAGRFSFNVAKGRCETCEGEGFVSVELLFMPSVYAPCPTCHGARYNAKTLEVAWNGRNIAEVLHMSVDEARVFFDGEESLQRPLRLLQDIGLGYLRLGQPATELSGGEAQRIKLATELQRSQRGDSLYVLDEPTTGLHPADVDKLIAQLQGLVDAGNTVVVVEHELRVVADSDWVIDVGPGAGEEGGRIVATGTPREVSRAKDSVTAPYLRRWFA